VCGDTEGQCCSFSMYHVHRALLSVPLPCYSKLGTGFIVRQEFSEFNHVHCFNIAPLCNIEKELV
jgi:hypothetical protein